MTTRIPLLACLAIVTAASIAAAQDMRQFSRGPIDVQSLRAQTLGNMFTEKHEKPARRVANPWGISFGRIPDLLYVHCPQLQDGRGLLVADVEKHGPADRAGLQAGQILLQMDDQVLSRPADLPQPRVGTEIFLLDRGELMETAVPAPRDTRQIVSAQQDPKPAAVAGKRKADAVESLAAPANRSMARSLLSEAPDSPQAISMAMANGQYQIEATVPAEKGQKTYRLEGTRREIDQQLKSVPTSLRTSIQKQLP